MLWRQLKHPNILPFYGVCIDEFAPRIAMVSPWMENGNLLDYLIRGSQHNPTRIDIVCAGGKSRLLLIDKTFWQILGIAGGLTYLHELKPQVVHGDIRAVCHRFDLRLSFRIYPLFFCSGQYIDE